MIWIAVIVTSLLAGFGVAGRGRWSPVLAGIFSFLTIILVGYSLFGFGLVYGLLFLLCAISIFKLSEKVFRRLMGTDKRPSLYDVQEENEKAQKEMDSLLEKVRVSKPR